VLGTRRVKKGRREALLHKQVGGKTVSAALLELGAAARGAGLNVEEKRKGDGDG